MTVQQIAVVSTIPWPLELCRSSSSAFNMCVRNPVKWCYLFAIYPSIHSSYRQLLAGVESFAIRLPFVSLSLARSCWPIKNLIDLALPDGMWFMLIWHRNRCAAPLKRGRKSS